MGADETDATGQLSRFASGFEGRDIPTDVLAEARRTLINYVGCVIGGSGHSTIEHSLKALAPWFGPGSATLLGRAETADPFNAALINGTANNVHGFDDTHLDTIVHPGAPILSAVLALVEQRPFTGRALLEALVVGVDVTCRIARAITPGQIDAGWHVSGTAGVFGATAAAGRLLGLDEARMRRALGLAACQPVGLIANFGTMGVSFHIGRAAQNGLMAALMAEVGFTASDNILDTPVGWFSALGVAPKRAALLADLGTRFEISQNTYKAYASAIVTHPVIDGCIDLATQHDVKPAQVAQIMLRTNPVVPQLTGRLPTTGLESKVSIQHCAAVALAERAGGIEQFGERAFNEQAIARLRGIVQIETSDRIAKDEAFLTLLLEDGRRLAAHIEHARGSVARPLTDSELEVKFRGLAATRLSDDAVSHVAELCYGIDDLTDAALLPRSCRLPN